MGAIAYHHHRQPLAGPRHLRRLGGARAWPLRLGVGVVVQVGVAVAMAVVVQVGWRLGWWLESRGLGWWELGVAAPSPSGSGHRGAGDTHADASLTSPRGLGLRAGACASTAALSSLRKRIDSALERGSESGTCFADPHSPWSPRFAPPAPQRIA